ncbi:MAG: response regulator, partial [Prolixibacteraceae bacterium]|nr:response regulator [Prolixibacteraceae bacterium]
MYGISMRETNSICQDHVGFIWTSSKAGILRVSDDDYRIYHLPYEKANIINVKLAYRDAKLYAYTNNGQFFLYNSISDKFDFLLNMSRLLNDNFLSLNKLQIDSEGRLWLASSVGLYLYNNGELNLIGTHNENINGLEFVAPDSLTFSKDDGLYKVDAKSLNVEQIFTVKQGSVLSANSLFYEREKNKLWIGTLSDGLYTFDFTKLKYSPVLINGFPKQPILAITPNTDSTLLCGIDGQGIWEINRHTNKLVNIYKDNSDNPYSLKGNGVYDIFCDDNERVWVSTYSGGLSFFDQASPLVKQISHVPNNPNSLVNNDVNSAIEASDGKLWFATNNGVSMYNAANDKWNAFYHNTQKQAQVFLSLCEDRFGRIWAGTYSSGVYLLDGKTGSEINHFSRSNTNTPFGNDYIFDIFRDSNDDIWIGGVQGNLMCYRHKSNKFEMFVQLPINTINELDENYLLLGCTYGLVKIDKKTGAFQNLLEGYLTYDMHVDGNDIWLCTSGNGLVRYNHVSGDIEEFNMEKGLPSNFINSINYSDGFFWLGTEGGLCRFDPSDKQVINYSSVLSLANVSFNWNAGSIMQNGQLIMGNNNGAIVFHPNELQQIQPKGKIYFHDIIVSGRSVRNADFMTLTMPIDSMSEFSLKHNNNTISIEMIPLGLTGEGTKFTWKLEGLETDWRQASSLRMLTYTNIPSGDFTLRIRMLDSSLTHIIDERSLKLNIIPPFWRTWWFLSLVLVFVMTLIFFLLLYYIDHLRKIHSEEKIRFFSNTAHDIRTALTLINAPIEELNKEKSLSQNGRYYLNLASEQAGRLSRISTQLLDFQKVDIGKEHLSLAMTDMVDLIKQRKMMFESFAQKSKVKLVFEHDTNQCVTAVDESMIEKVLDNLISNAIKYSKPNSLVKIILSQKTDTWALEVIDQGIGISRKAQRHLFKEFYRGENAVNSKIVGSGIGLLLVKNYVSLHGGNINCQSQENEGATFKVVVPLQTVSEAPKQKAQPEKFNAEYNVDVPQPELGAENRSMHVLVVEDNDDLRKFMKVPLSGQFKVSSAVDGKKAWEYIQKEMPDMVVSDVMMPNMDGFELCRLMKSTYETSHIPIILLTALAGKAEQLHGLGLGADDYLTKPFDMGILIQRIKTIVKNREQIRERAISLFDSNENEVLFDNELNDQFVKKAMQVIAQNLSNVDFGKEEFATQMNVSPSLLY